MSRSTGLFPGSWSREAISSGATAREVLCVVPLGFNCANNPSIYGQKVSFSGFGR